LSFRDWSEGEYEQFHDDAFANIFNEIPSLPYLDDERYDQAEALFEAGWLTFGEYSKEELDAIRDTFYDMVNMPEDMFDWEEYRELYNEH
jgi:hypothetical protein